MLVPLTRHLALDPTRIVLVMDYELTGARQVAKWALAQRRDSSSSTMVADATLHPLSSRLAARRSIALTDTGQVIILPWSPSALLTRLKAYEAKAP